MNEFKIEGTLTGRIKAAMSNMTEVERQRAPVAPSWSNCPQCHQSATGKYLKALSCNRCGWSSLGLSSRRNHL